MRTHLKKAKLVFLLSSLMLLLTLVVTTGASAKTIQRHTFIPWPIFVPIPQEFVPSPYLVFPIITPVGNTNQTLDNNDCFPVTIHGRFFSPSYYGNSQYANFYASDLSGDSLAIHPWYTQVNSEGRFTQGVWICGVSSTENLVTIVAVDNATGATSNPLEVDIS
jgi:hypothetical protein